MNQPPNDRKTELSPSQIIFEKVFHLLPTASFIIDYQGLILQANALACSLFENKTVALVHSNLKDSILVDIDSFSEFISDMSAQKNSFDKIILVRNNMDKVLMVNFHASFLEPANNLIILQITDISAKTYAYISELTSTLQHEIVLLRPYLNKAGKELLEIILNTNLTKSTDRNSSPTTNQLEFIHPSKSEKIAQLFPNLSEYEKTICGFLSLKLSFKEIAIISGKNANSLRVAFHRLLRKTSFNSGKELIRKLENM